MSRARIWEKMTVNEVRQALAETQTVMVPVGVTEQHGYHLTLDTDSQSAFQISKRAADETGAFVAPTLTYTFSGGELPGTINIDYHLVSLLISEIIRALCANGLKNIILVLGHGGSENDRATQEGAEMFFRQHPQYADRNVAVFRFWKDSELCRKAIEDGDFHAGYFETSMMMYWAANDVRPDVVLDEPELVARMRENPDNYQVFTANVDDPAVVKRVAQNPGIQVGVMGAPSKASVELGEAICRETVAGLVELVRKMEAE
ncbi:MAG: creatininase family protein [Bacteroidota bacterium]